MDHIQERLSPVNRTISDKDNLISGDDYTPDVMTSEVKTALQALHPHHLKEFLFFDVSKNAHRCPHCLAGRNQSEDEDDECEFVQFTGPDTMQCIVCLSSYSVAFYKKAIIDYFGYLDPKEQDDIKKELNEIS